MAPPRDDNLGIYREQHHWRTEPYRLGQASTSAEAAEFAKMLIRTFILLHGSALVAFPTLLTAVGVKIDGVAGHVVWIAIWLIAGLVLATFAGIAGFFALSHAADGNMTMIESSAYDAWSDAYMGQASDSKIQETQAKAVKLEKNADQLFDSYNRYRLGGVTALLLSLACFVAASITGILAAWPGPSML